MWFIYALSSAILGSFRKINDKHLSQNVHHLHLAWMMKAAALPVLGVLAFVTGQLVPSYSLPLLFWVSLLLSVCVTTPLDTATYLQSLKYGQLSKTAPLLTLWPVVMLLSGALFLGQIPSSAATLAVLIIVTGVYVLNTSRENRNLFHNIWHNRGTRFAVAGIGTVSLNTTVGAVGVTHSSPIFWAFWASLCSAVVQLVFAQIVAPGKFRHPHKKFIAWNGSIQGLSAALYHSAVSTGPIGYVTAIRSLSATFSAILGARIFKEGLDRRKITALTLIALGAAILGVEA